MSEHVSYGYFCTWYLALNANAVIDSSMQDRYDAYSTDLLARTARTFVHQHADKSWFRDLYGTADHKNSLQNICMFRFRTALENGDFNDSSATGSSAYAMDANVPRPITAEGDISPQTLCIGHIPPTIARSALMSVLSTHIPELEYLSVSAPHGSDLSRMAWAILKGDADSTKVRTQLMEAVLPNDVFGALSLQVSHYRQPAPNCRTRELWAQLNEENHVNQHLAQLEGVIDKIESTMVGESQWPAIVARTELDLRRRLDLGVEYLRRVYAFDYWDLRQYDSPMDLEVHSPPYSRAQPDSRSPLTVFDKWQAEFDKKLLIYLRPADYLSQVRLKSLSEMVSELISSKIVKESEGHYRCQVNDCTKLFQDIPFVRKHIEKRHTDWTSQVTQESQMLQNYLLDPNKTLPYKDFEEPRKRRQSVSNEMRNRRRSSPHQNRNGFAGSRGGRGEYRASAGQNYRDLDKPAEELPELDY